MRRKPWWDELRFENDGLFALVFCSKTDDYVSELYACEPGETPEQAAERICRKFGWHRTKPGQPKKKKATLRERVAKRVKKDLGIVFTSGPKETNRGRWSHNRDVVRWTAVDDKHRQWDSYDSMRSVLNAHHLSQTTPGYGEQGWTINAETINQERQQQLGRETL